MHFSDRICAVQVTILVDYLLPVSHYQYWCRFCWYQQLICCNCRPVSRVNFKGLPIYWIFSRGLHDSICDLTTTCCWWPVVRDSHHQLLPVGSIRKN